LTVKLPGRTILVMSPLAPLVGEPMNVTSVAAAMNRQVCSAWLIAHASINITILPWERDLVVSDSVCSNVNWPKKGVLGSAGSVVAFRWGGRDWAATTGRGGGGFTRRGGIVQAVALG